VPPFDVPITCCLITASDATLALVRRDPALYWRLACPEDVSAFERARAEERSGRGLLGRLLARAPRDELTLEDPEGELHLLERDWAGVHHLLTGGEGRGPLGFLRGGGHQIAVDAGYGPPQLFEAQQVRAIDAGLGERSTGELRARFDAARMTELGVHPGAWDERDRPGLMERVEALRDFLGRAARAGLGMAVELS